MRLHAIQKLEVENEQFLENEPNNVIRRLFTIHVIQD